MMRAVKGRFDVLNGRRPFAAAHTPDAHTPLASKLNVENERGGAMSMGQSAARSFAAIGILLLISLASSRSRAEPMATASDHRVAIRESYRPAAQQQGMRAITEIVRQSPTDTTQLDNGVLQLDFGRVAFGNLELIVPDDCEGTLTLHFGEKLNDDGSIDRTPPGTVRYSKVSVTAEPGTRMLVAPPPDQRNTQQGNRKGRFGNVTPPAVVTPSEWGVVTPFRWIEVEADEAIPRDFRLLRRAAFPAGWDDQASSFNCSDETLNRVWELCRYSIKATLFAGVYIDGDRERIPYEADAYLNQLSDYYTNGDPHAARRTFAWLMEHPTWPSEWGPHMVFMAHADWMHFGDVEWLEEHYEHLKSKMLTERCGEDGLVLSNQQQIEWNDIVDWPPGERDGYVRSPVNTVVNAFHLAAVAKMAELAEAIGATKDAENYLRHAERVRLTFHESFYDPRTNRYRDGREVDHRSQHASLFPLAFGLVPDDQREKVAERLVEDGMRCSVYPAQYLLEALFENGAGQSAVDLIVAPGGRSWLHMLDSDATITWEAWDQSVKPNLDWNHAWGAAPANLLPRYVLGIQPISPGWGRARIRPCPSGLDFARGTIPTEHGPVSVSWQRSDRFVLEAQLPSGVSASVHAPAAPGSVGVLVDGSPVHAVRKGDYWVVERPLSGDFILEVR